MTLGFYHPLGDSRWQERWGLPFGAFAVGQRFRHRPGVTLSQRDNVEEALDTFNAAMLHYDAAYAAQTSWKRPLMVSTTTLQRTIGMANKTFGDRTAILGFEEVALTGPLFDGDTIYAESEVLAVEEAAGVIVVGFRCVNADGTEIAKMRARMAIRRGETTPDRDPRFAGYHRAADGALVEQVGLFFEEFRVGDTFVHAPRRSFHAHECVTYGRRAFETDPATQDLDWIAEHGGRMKVPETFLISAVVALSTRSFGRVVANLGWYDIALPKPVHVGDTVTAESTVLESRVTRSRPGEGILVVETCASDQDGKPVVSYRRNLLVYRREADTPYAAAGY